MITINADRTCTWHKWIVQYKSLELFVNLENLYYEVMKLWAPQTPLRSSWCDRLKKRRLDVSHEVIQKKKSNVTRNFWVERKRGQIQTARLVLSGRSKYFKSKVYTFWYCLIDLVMKWYADLCCQNISLYLYETHIEAVNLYTIDRLLNVHIIDIINHS